MKVRDLVCHAVGVDTHRDTHTAAVIEAATGAEVAVEEASADRDGYEALVELADEHSQADQRVWAIEGTGSWGAGLTSFLRARGEWVIEVERPAKRNRGEGKSDEIDAVRAGRGVLGRSKWSEPRARGDREAVRALLTARDAAVTDRTRATNQLKALVVTAPDELRDRLRALSTRELVSACSSLRDAPTRDREWRTTVAVLRRVARRVGHLSEEIAQHDTDLSSITAEVCPQLLAEFGVGPVSAGQAFVSWSHQGRCRSEAAYASLAGTAPLEASSGQVIRHRLNRGGDRQLNRALHNIVITRTKYDQSTQDYIARRTAEGKNRREIRRCLKRFVARKMFRLLEAGAPTP